MEVSINYNGQEEQMVLWSKIHEKLVFLKKNQWNQSFGKILFGIYGW